MRLARIFVLGYAPKNGGVLLHCLKGAALGGFLLGTALTSSSSGSLAQDIEYGEYLAGECTTCHRKDGSYEGIPSITGWPAESFIAVMNEYRSEDRENPTMRTISRRLTVEDLEALAAYFETLSE